MTWANIVKNWKSSGAGVISAIAGLFAILYPNKSALISQAAQAISALFLAIFALSAKDNDVTGTAANPRAVIAGGEVAPPTPAAVTEAAPRVPTVPNP